MMSHFNWCFYPDSPRAVFDCAHAEVCDALPFLSIAPLSKYPL